MAIYEFQLPDIGEGVVEGEIVKWLVSEGDPVAEDQPLVEVMTDKATVTIPSPKRGRVVKTHGNVGDMAKIHQPLVTLELEGSVAAAPPPPRAAQPAPAARLPGNDEGAQKVLATPVTRRIARELGIDLAAIHGTGPQGRVLKSDVTAAATGSVRAANELAPPPEVARGEQRIPVRAPPPPQPIAPSPGDERVPLRGLRKRIAEKMVRSKFTAPHYTFVEELDATELVRLRGRLNEQLAAAGDTMKLSFLPFLCKALVAAFRKYPTLNANMDEAAQELVVRKTYNLGIAVATEEGLTVPVVRGVERMSLRELSDEIARLSAAARERRLKLEELTGGTFTITSLGQSGGLLATPIINHPEVAILGVHRIRKRPVVRDDRIEIREMMNLSLSFDHRVVDGAVGANFTYELIRHLERPELLFLELT